MAPLDYNEFHDFICIATVSYVYFVIENRFKEILRKPLLLQELSNSDYLGKWFWNSIILLKIITIVFQYENK